VGRHGKKALSSTACTVWLLDYLLLEVELILTLLALLSNPFAARFLRNSAGVVGASKNVP